MRTAVLTFLEFGGEWTLSRRNVPVQVTPRWVSGFLTLSPSWIRKCRFAGAISWWHLPCRIGLTQASQGMVTMSRLPAARSLAPSALVGVVLSSLSVSALALPVSTSEFTTFLAAESLGDTTIVPGVEIFPGSRHIGGFGPTTVTPPDSLRVSFDRDLDADGYGTLRVRYDNFGPALSNVRLLGFLDAEIGGFLGEYGARGGDDPGFLSAASSWEIDEPGFSSPFGDIFFNAEEGRLDGSNGVPTADEPNDVSLALGFDIGTLLSRESLVATFSIDRLDNGGLHQVDLAGGELYYNGGFDVVPVPLPPAVLLFSSGLAILFLGRRPKRRGGGVLYDARGRVPLLGRSNRS